MGLCIGASHPWLAGSPDGIMLLIIQKRNQSCKKLSVQKQQRTALLQRCAQKSSFSLVKNEGKLWLKTCHSYNYQVQVQVFVAWKRWCDFCVYGQKELFVQRLRFNRTFILDIFLKCLFSSSSMFSLFEQKYLTA